MMRIRPTDCTDDFRAVMFHATAHARRLGHLQKDGEHLLLALAAMDTPVGAVLREHGITPERVEEEIVRREGLGAELPCSPASTPPRWPPLASISVPCGPASRHPSRPKPSPKPARLPARSPAGPPG
jgi:Clp amino terminal domain, pathogenicity island component